MQNRNKLSLLDRSAIGLLSGVFGLVVSCIVWVAVALATGNPTHHAAPFVFSGVTFAVAGFLLGSSFAELAGVVFQGVWIAVNAWLVNPGAEAELGEKPLRPVWALVFLVSVIVVTIWLSLP